MDSRFEVLPAIGGLGLGFALGPYTTVRPVRCLANPCASRIVGNGITGWSVGLELEF